MNLLLLIVFLTLLGGCRAAAPSGRPAAVRLVGASDLLDDIMKTYNKNIPNLTFSRTLGRPGSIGAVDAVESGLGEAALTGSGAAYTAFTRGTGELPYPHRSLRGMAVVGTNALHLVLRPDLTFRSFASLRGKRIAIGPPGTNTEVTARMLLPAFGIPESDLEALPFSEIPRRLADRTLDAHFFVVTYPSPVIQADLAVPGTHLISIRGPEVSKLREKYPYFRPIVVYAGTYPGQQNDLETLGLDLLLVCRADLSEEIVYAMLPRMAGLSRH